MSTTVDERVVEMRFDNKHFESNVATSMSTLDKLKKKLNLSGASKGLEEIESASKRINMSGLCGAVDTVKAKFSALDVVAVTALANITNSAVNAGKRIISALTIDPVKTGFQEYETQIKSIQTILANTQKEGTDVARVNAALDELNKYADKTIYNFTEMTRNIGTFTAAGVKLDTSVNAIKGIANLAAVSGSTSQQASVAMYQLSQALASGRVKLMDWNSVVNAGMGGQVFQDALIRTSEHLQTGAKAAIEAEGSFRDSLTTGWLTTEVLTETLDMFATAADTQQEYEAAVKKFVEKGYTEEEAKQMADMARTAGEAATKVKTFTQLWDVLKEAAQSGWSQTWRIIIGDFEEAKNLFSPLSEFLTDFINKTSDWRNNILEGAFDFAKPWKSITDKLNGAGFDKIKGVANSFEKVTEKVKSASDKLEYFQDIVNRVWRGDFNNVGDNPDRFDLLTKAGYDPRVVQDLVNKGYQYKLTLEDVEAAHKKFGLTMETTAKETEKTTEVINEETSAYSELSDEQLIQAGLTEDEISLYRALEKEAKRLGITVSELADEMSKNDGRTLLIDSFKNFGNAILEVGEAIKKAWGEIFNIPSVGEIAVKLYGAIKSLNDFSKKLRLVDDDTGEFNETGKKLVRTFKGLFAIVDVVTTVLGGGLKIAFKIVSAVLEHFNLDILDVTASIGDALVKFRDWIFENNALAKGFDWVLSKIPVLIGKFKEWLEVFKQTPAVQKFAKAIKDIGDAFSKLTSGEISLSEFASSIGENLAKELKSLQEIAIQIGKDFIAGFQNGIGDSISGVIKKIVNFCLEFVSSFAEALGVQSPSWKAYEIIVDFFKGAWNAIKDMIKPVLNVLKQVGEKIVEVFKSFWEFITDENGDIEWGKLFAGGAVVAMLFVLKKLANAFNGIANAIGDIDKPIVNAGKVLKSFSKVLNGIAFDFKAKALLKMTIAIGVLVAAILVLTQIDDIGKLWNAVGVIAVLALILVGLAVAMSKLSDASIAFDAESKSLNVKGLQNSILQIGLAILMLAAAVKLIGDLDPEKAKQGFIGLAEVAGGLIVFLAIMGGISRYSGDANSVGKMMLKIAIAMGIMALVMRAVGRMDPSDIIIGLAVMEAFALLCIEMGIANRIAGMFGDNFGGNVLKISVAMGIMILAMKMISSMDPADVINGIAALQAFVILIGEMAIINRLAGENKSKFGGTIMSMANSMLIMASVIWILSKMDESDIDNGIKIMQKFVLLIGEMILVSKLAGKESAKIAGNILAMSVAISILAGIAVLLSFVDIKNLAKGITAVGILGLIMAAMIKATRGTQNVKGNLITMTVAIAIMAGAIVALSFIDGSKLAGATAAIGSLMLIFGLMTKLSSGLSSSSITSIIVMLGVVSMLAGLLLVLNHFDIGNTLEVAASISIMMLALASSLALIAAVGPLASKAIGGIAVMTAVLFLLSVAIALLVNVKDIDKALSVATSLSTLLLALSAACLVISVGSAIMTVAGAGIGIMIGVIIAMGTLMAAIAGLVTWIPDLESFLGKALPILKLIGQGIGEFLGGIVLGIGTAVLQLLPQLGLALSTFMIGVQPFIALASNVDSSVVAGAGYLTAAILCLTVANFISGIAQFMNGGVSFSDLGTQLMTFGIGAMCFLNMIKGVDASAVEAATNIADMILALTTSEVISSINEKFGGSVDFSTMGQNLKTFGEAVVGFSETISGKIDVAAVEAATNAGSLLVELNKSLPRSGGWVQDIIGEQDFEKFSKACKAFAECIIGINETVSQEGFEIQSEKISQIVTAGTQFSELNSALPRTGGIAQDLAGEQDLVGFGMACTAFAGCMITISQVVSNENFEIQSEKISQLVAAGKQFNELNTALPKTGGIAQDLAGTEDLAGFGAACEAFVDCMVSINNALNQEGFSVNLEAMESLKKAGLKMNELQEALPKSGGWWQDIAGSTDIGDFGEKIKTFATAIVEFSTSSTGLDMAAINLSINTAYRIKSLIESLVGLDTSGVDAFTGIGSGGFGADGPAYDIAKAMSKFSSEVDNINTEAVTVAVSSAKKLKVLIASLVGLDTSGIENFKPGAIGKEMKNYSDKVADINTGTVSSSISSANRLKNFISSLSGLDTSGIVNFKVGSIGSSLKTYSTSVSGFNASAVSSSIMSANRLKGFIASLVGLNTSGVGAFKSSINQLSTTNVAELVKAFSGASSKLQTAGADMINGLITGMQSKLSSLKTMANSMLASTSQSIKSKVSLFSASGQILAAKLATGFSSKKAAISSSISSCLSSAVSTIRGKYNSFYSAGSYLVTGFCNGISDNAYKAAAKSKAMAESAVKAAREALKINSPSKVFKEIGSGIPEGFAIGIGMLGSTVKKSVTGMASMAITSTRSAMTNVLDALNSNMDANPTIRPVIDLTNVRSGANAINGMFNGIQTVGVRSNLNAINAMMNAKLQNGTNDDIISAINKLNDGLESNRGDTYNFGDFTYDDGSNISDAVRTLVRAAKMGRRV